MSGDKLPVTGLGIAAPITVLGFQTSGLMLMIGVALALVCVGAFTVKMSYRRRRPVGAP